MAIIHGCSESEKNIIQACSFSIKKHEDIDLILQKLNNQLKEKKDIFSKQLPKRINEEEEILKKFRNELSAIKRKLEEEIKSHKNILKENKKNKKWFSVLINYIQLFKLEHFPKHEEMYETENNIKQQEITLLDWKNNSLKIFNRNETELLNKIDGLNRIKVSPYYPGAVGEIKVLNELSRLDNKYQILGGLNVELDDYVSYNGEWNLKSAQMDFVIVCLKGVFLIEVKNWSSSYYNHHTDISPYEQLSRAGRVLYIFLKSELGNEVKVKNILIPIQNNIPYNQKYNFISVFDLYQFKNYIENRPDVLSDQMVKQIVNLLKPFATY